MFYVYNNKNMISQNCNIVVLNFKRSNTHPTFKQTICDVDRDAEGDVNVEANTGVEAGADTGVGAEADGGAEVDAGAKPDAEVDLRLSVGKFVCRFSKEDDFCNN